MGAGVDVHIERAFEHDPDRRGEDEGERQRGEKRQPEPVDQNDRDVAARHGEGAMREIDEVHQPERDREPACHHKQQHAVGDTVEQDGEHGSGRALSLSPVGERVARSVAARRVRGKRDGESYFFSAFTGSFTASKVANSWL